MLFFGHIGIGQRMVQPWAARLPLIPLYVGTVLPDLIDKPLYYSLAWMTGRRSLELGMICGSRTIGHTALLVLTLTFLAMLTRSLVLAALSLGVGTHLVLDALQDRLMNIPWDQSSALQALLFPFRGAFFSPMPFADFADHASHSFHALTIGGEILGIALLLWEAWKRRNKPGIVAMIRSMHTRRWRPKFARRLAKKRLSRHGRDGT